MKETEVDGLRTRGRSPRRWKELDERVATRSYKMSEIRGRGERMISRRTKKKEKGNKWERRVATHS